jgi:hypothetical protein
MFAHWAMLLIWLEITSSLSVCCGCELFRLFIVCQIQFVLVGLRMIDRALLFDFLFFLIFKCNSYICAFTILFYFRRLHLVSSISRQLTVGKIKINQNVQHSHTLAFVICNTGKQQLTPFSETNYYLNSDFPLPYVGKWIGRLLNVLFQMWK